VPRGISPEISVPHGRKIIIIMRLDDHGGGVEYKNIWAHFSSLDCALFPQEPVRIVRTDVFPAWSHS